MLPLGPIPRVIQPCPAAELLLRRDAARFCSRLAITGCRGAGFGGGARVLLHAVCPRDLGRLLHRLAGLLGLGLRLRLQLRLQDQVRRRMHDWAATQRRRRLRGGLAATRGILPCGAERAPPCCLTPAKGTPQSAPDTETCARCRHTACPTHAQVLTASGSLGARCILLPLTQLLPPPLLDALPLCQAAVPRRRVGSGVAAAAVAVRSRLAARRRALFAGQ